MLEFSETNKWEGAVLSARPLVIFNGETGKPRYYEFRVIRNGEEIGAISCVADEDEGEPVQYVMPYAKTFKDENARAIQKGSGRLIDAGYPATLLSRAAGASRNIDVSSGEEDTGLYPVDMKVKDMLESMSADMLEEMGIRSQQMYENILAEQMAIEEHVNAFWGQINDAKEKMLSLSDTEIVDAFENAKNTSRAYASGSKTLTSWLWKADWYNPRGYCGPNAVAFVTLGLGTNSGYPDIPVSFNRYSQRDYDKLTAFYNVFENKIGTGAKLFSTLDSGLRSLTNYKLDHFSLFYNWNEVHNLITRYDMPGISLRGSKFTLDWKTWQFHYRVVIGTKWETNKYDWYYWFFKWRYAYSTYETTGWYLMHDNTAEGYGNYWYERAGQYFQLAYMQVEHN